MQSETERTDDEVINTLPPMITNNTRVKLNAEQVSIDFTIIPKEKQKYKQNKTECMHQPQPIYPLKLVYFPKELYFEMENVTVVHSLRVWNASMRSLYISCAGIWDKSEHLGVSWNYYPRTGYLLAPGLAADFYIKAIPKDFASIPSLRLALQLAAAHKRDNIVVYFSVPIVITFLK